jgi:hypothetical protein
VIVSSIFATTSPCVIFECITSFATMTGRGHQQQESLQLRQLNHDDDDDGDSRQSQGGEDDSNPPFTCADVTFWVLLWLLVLLLMAWSKGWWRIEFGGGRSMSEKNV